MNEIQASSKTIQIEECFKVHWLYEVHTESKVCYPEVLKDIAKYYNYRCTPVLVFHSGDKMFLDFLDIYTMYSSTKLSH